MRVAVPAPDADNSLPRRKDKPQNIRLHTLTPQRFDTPPAARFEPQLSGQVVFRHVDPGLSDFAREFILNLFENRPADAASLVVGTHSHLNDLQSVRWLAIDHRADDDIAVESRKDDGSLFIWTPHSYPAEFGFRGDSIHGLASAFVSPSSG